LGAIENRKRIHTKNKPHELVSDVSKNRSASLEARKMSKRTWSENKFDECDASKTKNRPACMKNRERTRNKNKRHECDVSKRRPSSLEAVERLERAHTENKLPESDISKSRSSNLAEAVEKLERTRTENKLDEFDISQSRPSNLETMEKHERAHTDNKLYESEVSETKSRHSSLAPMQMRERTHTENKPHQYDVLRVFPDSSNLSHHKIAHAEPVECDVCKVTFTQEHNLIAHKMTHLEDTPMFCKTCGGKMPKPQEAQDGVDMQLELAPISSKRDVSFQCDFCQEIESNEPSGIGYVCSLCGCGFGNLKKLEDHVISHSVVTVAGYSEYSMHRN
jgi:KRAB domain-containing zinc finger protein